MSNEKKPWTENMTENTNLFERQANNFKYDCLELALYDLRYVEKLHLHWVSICSSFLN